MSFTKFKEIMGDALQISFNKPTRNKHKRIDAVFCVSVNREWLVERGLRDKETRMLDANVIHARLGTTVWMFAVQQVLFYQTLYCYIQIIKSHLLPNRRCNPYV